jgi:uncharacterized protein (TIGR02284 family)
MENEKSVNVLNALIQINNDRIEGYETAAKETEDSDLKSLFAHLQSTSQNNLNGLRTEVMRLGGAPEEGTRVTGKFFRVWMDVKAALTGNDRKAILNSCEFGEDKALETYEDTIEDNSEKLSSEQLAMIREQQAHLRADHDRIKSLRDAV